MTQKSQSWQIYYYFRVENLAAYVFNARLAQANLITKAAFDAQLSSRNKKVATNKSKYFLAENELKS